MSAVLETVKAQIPVTVSKFSAYVQLDDFNCLLAHGLFSKLGTKDHLNRFTSDLSNYVCVYEDVGYLDVMGRSYVKVTFAQAAEMQRFITANIKRFFDEAA